MNEEQKIINDNTDKRLTKLEEDVKEIRTTVTDIRIDQKLLIETVNRSNDRWEEFDKTQRKNKNEIIMKFVTFFIATFLGYIVAVLNLTK